MLERKNKPTTLLSKMAASMGLILVSFTYVLWHHLVQLPRAHIVTLKSRPHNVLDAARALQRKGLLKAAPSVSALPASQVVPEPLAAAIAHPDMEKSPSLATPPTPGRDQVALAAPSIAHSAPILLRNFRRRCPRPRRVVLRMARRLLAKRIGCPPQIAPCLYLPTAITWPVRRNGLGAHASPRYCQDHLLYDVQFVLFPEERRQSLDISAWALPILAEEAIEAQSAEVGIVSQATFTSTAFRTSLGSALVQAKVNPAKN